MNRIKLLLIIAVTASLVSCDKNDAFTNQPQLDSTFLKQVIGLSPSAGGGVDTLSVITYSYDELKRPLSLSMHVVADLRNNSMGFTAGFNYHYVGAGVQPYLVTIKMRNEIAIGYDYDDSIFLDYRFGFVTFDSSIARDPLNTASTYNDIYRTEMVGDSFRTTHVFKLYDTNGLFNQTSEQIVAGVQGSAGNMLQSGALYNNFKRFEKNTFTSHPDPAQPFYIPFPYGYRYLPREFVAYKQLRTFAGTGGTDPSSMVDWLLVNTAYTWRADGYPLTANETSNYGLNKQLVYVYH